MHLGVGGDADRKPADRSGQVDELVGVAQLGDADLGPRVRRCFARRPPWLLAQWPPAIRRPAAGGPWRTPVPATLRASLPFGPAAYRRDRLSAASTALRKSIAIVVGPTPPTRGVIQP